MAKIKIIKKNQEYSLEYEVGDIFEVQGTWYGGVHIAGRSGIPVSLDKNEYEEVKEAAPIQLKKLNCAFSICKVADYSEVNLEDEFSFPGKTDQENSLVCLTSSVPSNATEREDGWKAFRIEGILEFSLIGILSRIAGILAEEKIGIFVISTFNTDYVLVKAENYEKALKTLADKGYEILE